MIAHILFHLWWFCVGFKLFLCCVFLRHLNSPVWVNGREFSKAFLETYISPSNSIHVKFQAWNCSKVQGTSHRSEVYLPHSAFDDVNQELTHWYFRLDIFRPRFRNRYFPSLPNTEFGIRQIRSHKPWILSQNWDGHCGRCWRPRGIKVSVLILKPRLTNLFSPFDSKYTNLDLPWIILGWSFFWKRSNHANYSKTKRNLGPKPRI